MDTTDTNKINNRKKNLIILIWILSIFIIYYSVMSMLGPVNKLKQIKNEYGINYAEDNQPDKRIFTDSTYLKLLKEKSFIQSKVEMAGTDSIYLIINLADSIINIEISGVVVHEVRISKKKVSKMFLNSDENLILSMLASPFTISKNYSTIPKEPLMIKMAPKDTSEYKPDIMPDTSITVPVNFILNMTNGTKIYVYQDENEKFPASMKLSLFRMKDRIRSSWSTLKSVALLKVPEYHPFIKIWLPRSDAKIIYRAIPRQGQVGIYR